MSVNVTVIEEVQDINIEISKQEVEINISIDQFASERAVQASIEAKEARDEAEISATNALISAQNALASEQEANQSKLDAQTAKNDAESARDQATSQATISTEQAVISTNQANISTQQATIATSAVQSIEGNIQDLGNISGTVNINLALGTLITATLTGTTTLTFSGLPPSTRETAFTLRFAGIHQINLPSGTRFPNGTAPTPSGVLYELPCSINSSGQLIVYGSINDIRTP
jgi:hypothetical protein